MTTVVDDDGFTIVEMLVGLCITALVATLLAITLLQLRPIRALTEAAETQVELEAVANYLDGLLSNTRRLPLLGNDPNRKAVFEGGPQGMGFVSIARVESDESSLRDITLSVQKAGEGLQLVQTSTARRLFSKRKSTEVVIASKLDIVEFKYVRTVDELKDSIWTGDWSDSNIRPLAVKMTLARRQLNRILMTNRIVFLD